MLLEDLFVFWLKYQELYPRLEKYKVIKVPHQQRFEIQHVFFAQDDKGGGAAESVAAVGLQPWHSTEATLPVLTTGARRKRH